MKNTTLTVTFNTEKLDALTFHMEKKSADLQNELNETIQKLYEKYVPQATREYIDDKVSRDAQGTSPPPIQTGTPTSSGSYGTGGSRMMPCRNKGRKAPRQRAGR